MPNRYFVMRHGESVANRQGIIVSDPRNALDSFGLTSLGAEQVMNIALKTRLNEEVIIVSSDYLRARETAEIMHGIVCVNHSTITDSRLRERDFGKLELTDHSNYTSVWEADKHSPNRRINGVEPVNMVLSRTLSLIHDLDSQYTNNKILLVSHGDVLQILLAAQKGMEPRFHRLLEPLENAEIRALKSATRLCDPSRLTQIA